MADEQDASPWADKIFLFGVVVASVMAGLIAFDAMSGGKVSDWLTRQAFPKLASVTEIGGDNDRDAG